MAPRKSGLGRGLDALIPVDRPDLGYAVVDLDQVVPNPQQPRTHFPEASLKDLADSIREVGLLQPIVVRPATADGEHVLVAGERRWRAARMAGMEAIPVIIRQEGDARANLTEALVENVQRENLSPLEEASAYQQLIEDFGLVHDDVAKRVGKSRSTITNTLRLLQLPAALQGMLEREEISATHARALLGCEDGAYAVHLGEKIAVEGWSVRQTEEAVRARNEGPAAGERRPTQLPTPRPAAIVELEERLSERLSTKVKIDYGDRGGRLTVRFSDLDDLERIYRHFFS